MKLNDFCNKVCWHEFSFGISKNNHDVFLKKIENFTQEMQSRDQSSSYYSENRKASFPKKDIEIGKYGEFAASLALRCGKITNEKFPILMPDFQVRTGGGKGWDCDLPFSQVDTQFPNCHVKTCDQNTSDFVSRTRDNKYTWTFQYNNVSGIGGRDKLFSTPNSDELILFMFVPNLHSKQAIFVASAPWNKIQGILKDPIAEKFKGLKKCVYSNDLMSLERSCKCI